MTRWTVREGPSVILTVMVGIAAVAGCGPPPVAQSTLVLLRYGDLDGGPTALTNGTIRFTNGCTWIDGGEGVSDVMLWPPGARVEIIGGAAAVVVEGVTLRHGDTVALGGGEYRDEIEWVRHLVGPIPPNCAANAFWLATTVTKT